jgi:hypothetical protein
MNPSDAAALARIWADSTPLYTFVEDRLKQLPDESPAAASNVATAGTKPVNRKRRKRSATPSGFETLAASLDSMSAAIEVGRKHNDRFKRVTAAMMDDLIAGRLACIGRPAQSYVFKKIDPSFWIGARVQWYGNAVIRGDEELIEVRVTKSIPAQIEDRPEKGPGRPSKANVIRDAIVEYAKGDPRLNRPPFERYRAYRAYISDRGYDPRKDSGFKDKTFEKYEAEYRRRSAS